MIFTFDEDISPFDAGLWESNTGNPGGCVHLNFSGDYINPTTILSNLNNSGVVQFDYRFIGTDVGWNIFDGLVITVDGLSDPVFISIENSSDSGWLSYEIRLEGVPSGDGMGYFHIGTTNGGGGTSGYALIDNLFYTEIGDPIPGEEVFDMPFPGCWPDGIGVKRKLFGTFSELLLGAMVANEVMAIYTTYESYYVFDDYTLNLNTCSDGFDDILHDVLVGGTTYAADRYREIYCNVRAVWWI